MKNTYRKYIIKDSLTIGTSPYCDLQYYEKGIEPFHAEIHWKKKIVVSAYQPKLSGAVDDFKVLKLEELIIIPTEMFVMINQLSNLKINLFPYHHQHRGIRKRENPKAIQKQVRFLKNYPQCSVSFKRIPEIPKEQKTPLVLTIGPVLFMSLASLFSGTLSAYNGYLQGREFREILPMLLLPMVMVLSVFIYHPLQRRYEKNKRKKQLIERENQIQRAIFKVEEQLIQFKNEKEHCDHQRFHNEEELIKLDQLAPQLLFSKTEAHDDFLKIQLAQEKLESKIQFGDIPSEEDEPYFEKAKELIQKWKFLDHSWVVFDLYHLKNIALAGEIETWLNFILLQLSLYYDSQQVEICVISTKKWLEEHAYLYAIPHTKRVDGTRTFAVNQAQTKELLKSTPKKYQVFIIQDKSIFEKENVEDGFCIYLETDEKKVPWFCKAYLVEENQCFFVDQHGRKEISKISKGKELKKALQRVQFLDGQRDENEIQQKNTFFELYKIKDGNEVDIEKRWEQTQDQLKVPIGFGQQGEIITLDLHEKGQGPHMMIGATTGAGKSEFITTFLLSLAVHFSPEKTQFAIIDFKGGGLSESFQLDEFVLPHLTGVLTNLEQSEMQRVLISLRIECHRRQVLFNKMKKEKGLSIMTIDHYQQLWEKDSPLESVAHLFLVVDEFAELKVSAPEFIAELVSFARIGRSLGIHLILSTQKPSLAIDSEIWSNTRCKVCLKVQERQDSVDMVGTDDAFYFSQAGTFVLKVDQEKIKGQTAWVNAPINTLVNEETVELVDEQGKTRKRNRPTAIALETEIRQVLSIIKKQKYSRVDPLWLPPIKKIPLILPEELVIGMVDDFYNKKQSWLIHSFEKEGHGVVYSLNMDEKKKMIKTLLRGIPKEKEVEIIFCDSLYNFQYLRGESELHYITSDELDQNFLAKLQNRTPQSKKTIFIITHFPLLAEKQEFVFYHFGSLLRDGPLNNLFVFIFTTTASTIPYRWQNYLMKKYCLQTNQKSEINQIFESNVKIDEVKEGYGLVSGKQVLSFKLIEENKEN